MDIKCFSSETMKKMDKEAKKRHQETNKAVVEVPTDNGPHAGHAASLNQVMRYIFKEDDTFERKLILKADL